MTGCISRVNSILDVSSMMDPSCAVDDHILSAGKNGTLKNLYPTYSFLFFMVAMSLQPAIAWSQCEVDYSTTNYFCDHDTLLLHANPVSGTPPFTFLWETGETTQTIFIPHAIGDWLVTMTDATGCVDILNCHIKPNWQVLGYPYSQTACEGETETLFLEWFRDSIPGAQYLWSTGATTPTITLTDDLVWSVTITDPATGCEFIIPPGLFEFYATPYPEIVGGPLLCNGSSTTLSVTGGPFGSIVWYPPGWQQPEYQPTWEATVPGEYIVWTSSPEAGFCWHQDTIILEEGIIDPPIVTGPPDLCPGQTGTVSLTNASLFSSYIWSSGQTTSSFTVDDPGIYTVTVTNSEGCTASTSITIESNTGAELSTDITSANCGQSDGSIDLTTNPPQSYDYLWSNGSSNQDLQNILPGNYTVTVTDNNGCTSVETFLLPDEPIDITINATITPNDVCSNYNGSIQLIVLPVETYAYAWSTGSTSDYIDNLAPGIYSVTVTLGTNCIETATFTIEDNSNAADVQTIVTEPVCGLPNGTVNLQINGGTGPFTYIWSNGNTTESLENISSGNYYVTVTGADGCTTSALAEVVNEDPDIIITGLVTPNTSCDQSNGEIDISILPASDYDYMWSNGMTTEDLFNVGAGTYDVTVTSGNTCIETASFIVINENIPFSISGIVNANTSCTSPNGAIDVSATPAGVFTFLWSTGETTEDLSSLSAGTYTVTVMNEDGCAIGSPFIVGNTTTSFTISALTLDNTSCQVPNGSIDISVLPIGSYTYAWSTGATSEDLQGISAGSFQVTVSDINGCSSDTSFVINDLSTGFSVTGNTMPNTSCTNQNGAIDISITPVGSYTYLWSNGATTEDITATNGGTYIVTVVDVNSCSSSAEFTIVSDVSLPVLSAIVTDEICGAANGMINLTVTPPVGTISWSNGSNTEDLFNLGAGDFIAIVTSVNGCTTTDTFHVSSVSNNFSITATPVDNSSCINPNGGIDLTIQPAGSYSFSWSTGSLSEDLQNLDAGPYSVTVTDNTLCSSMAVFDILSSTTIPVISEIILPASCGQPNGTINITVSGATGSTFQWSDNATTEDLVNVLSGTYSVTVTDSNGCSASASYMLPDQSSNFSVTGVVGDDSSCTSNNGSITLNVTPSGAYSYVWSDGSTSNVLSGVGAGTYHVTVSDAFNCSSSSSFIVSDISFQPIVNYSVTPASCSTANGGIHLTISSSSAYTILWSNGASGEDLQNILPGTYDVVITTSAGCTSNVSVEVPNMNSNFAVSSVIKEDASCTQFTGSIDLTIVPAGSYSFQWSNGATTEDLNNISSGIYLVIITDSLNCASPEEFIVEDISEYPLVSEVITNATCQNTNGAITLNAISTDPVSYSWSTGDITKDLQHVAQGIYSVTVTNINGCSTEKEIMVPGTEPLVLDLDADISSINTNGFVHISLSINVPLQALDSILWSPSFMMDCYHNLCLEQSMTITQPTEVRVIVKDTSGCDAQISLRFDIGAEYKVFIPNVFTPNGDGPNDKFTVFSNEEIEEVVILEIFDRWGNKVFVNEHFPSNEPNYGWDGLYSGELMNPAVYAYRAVVKYLNGEEHAFKGDVTLVR